MRAPLFIGERVALDFVNTQMRSPGGEDVDVLETQDALRSWLDAEKDRLVPILGEVKLEAVRDLRAQITRAVDDARRGTAPPVSALRAITAALRRAPAYPELSWDGSAVTSLPRRTDDPTRNLLAELAEDAADLLADPSIQKVRQCEGPECRLLFLPAHPRRRWCSPLLCGNRVRVARYYERNKTPGQC